MMTNHPNLPLADIAERLGITYYDSLADFTIELHLATQLPLALVKNRNCLPLCEIDGIVQLAVSDPTDLLMHDEISRLLGKPVRAVAIPQECIATAIHDQYSKVSASAKDAIDHLAEADLSAIATELSKPQDLLDLADEAPVIRLLNAIIFEGVKERASDIHIEPYELTLEVRFRIDGMLYPKLSPPKVIQDALASRVKILASLNIAEKRLPQDGRIKVIVAGHEVDIRVSTVPTIYGERIVLRLLDKSSGVRHLDHIGCSLPQADQIRKLLARSNGIILVTGPTGSGKTSTLYAAVSHLNTSEKNIITIEDPIEYQLTGTGQIQVNSKIDLTFATGLRSILRQDPDVIMVGEIRDQETAEIAMQASLTGHLVLSTLHTNDAATAITRLLDMGIEPFMIASSLSAVLAQRLVRIICPACKESYHSDGTLSDAPTTLYRGTGCTLCHGQGFIGRTGIYELLIIDSELTGMITRRATAKEIKQYAFRKTGMVSMREDGMAKVAAGITTLEELLRVTQDEYVDL